MQLSSKKVFKMQITARTQRITEVGRTDLEIPNDKTSTYSQLTSSPKPPHPDSTQLDGLGEMNQCRKL